MFPFVLPHGDRIVVTDPRGETLKVLEENGYLPLLSL